MNTITDFKNKYDADHELFGLKMVNLQTEVLTYHNWLWSKSDPDGSPSRVEIEAKPTNSLIDCTWRYYLSELQDDIIRIKVWTADGVEEYKD